MDTPAYHTDEQYLLMLAAIRATPDDDLPRLVAADQLDEWGFPERAELIRVQCHELYRKPCEQVSYPLDDHPDIGIYCLDYYLGRDEIEEHWCPQCKVRHRANQLTYTDNEYIAVRSAHSFKDGGSWVGKTEVQYTRGFIERFEAPFSQFVANADRLEPEAVDITVRMTDRPVVEYRMEYRIVPLPPSTPWHVRTGQSQSRLVGCEWRDGHLDTEELLRLEYPWVNKWELPPHRLHEGLVGHWHVNEAGELVVTDLRRRGLDGNVSEDDQVQVNATIEFDVPRDTP